MLLIFKPRKPLILAGFFMDFESLRPFLIIVLQTIGIVLLIEAVVIYFFKIRRFWAAVGIAVLINLLSLILLYAGASIAEKLGYEFNGLQLPVQVMLFLWWLSVISDGFLLQLTAGKMDRQKLYLSSLLMNTLSFLFLYFFVVNSQ